jgi:N-methylhydantoinase A/oxoprolinase/acetone carboxylase beta subunit
MAWRIGVDSGGTFTDICLFDGQSGRIAVWKVSSTAADPARAVAEELSEALAQIGDHRSMLLTRRFSFSAHSVLPDHPAKI